jgi:hypothetical protein
MTIQWNLVMIKLKDLKENPKNPREITKEQFQHLTDLVAKFGLIDKPIVNLDFMVIGGHQRLRVLKKMKVKEVECWQPDHLLNEEEIDHLGIGLNLNQGQWDYDLLANNFEALDLLNWGFSESELVGSFSPSEELQEKEACENEKCPTCGKKQKKEKS